MKSKARTPSRLADEVGEAIKTLTANRTTHTYATQWIMAGEVERHLGVEGALFEAALELWRRLGDEADQAAASWVEKEK